MAQKLEWAACELSAYQGGFLLVRFDFVHNVLVWKDSNRWFNNFVRGLPEADMDVFRQVLETNLRELLKEDSGDLLEGPQSKVWRLIYKFADEPEMEHISYDGSINSWRRLASLCSEAGGRSFVL
ncbi:MAG: hypothetical protein Q4P65_00190 [Eubacteriales bacterium]|nr:hypothetical protein [Eubacteriales bacterium]